MEIFLSGLATGAFLDNIERLKSGANTEQIRVLNVLHSK